MAKLHGSGKLDAEITIRLTEEEAAALDALAGYGTKSFLEVFYKHMGRAYLEPHEAGLVSLFESVHGGPASVSNLLERAADARKVFHGMKRAVDLEKKC